ncbi:UxaA family hydrolase [Lentilitoribacter sp. EG35]|uniref:UxaA family hydrolase n=1 Tax=Lentilitoribacter sp. EG35 TaxID=3234192 RepID=UPI00345F4D41
MKNDISGSGTSSPTLLQMHPADGVAITCQALPKGALIRDGLKSIDRIPPGHKVALRPHTKGESILRYGQIIGFASAPIAAGQHVHLNNLKMGEVSPDYAFCEHRQNQMPTQVGPTFMGYNRKNGKYGTRNFIGIISTVNCSAHVADLVARTFEKNPVTGYDPLAQYPNVDGVIALTHKTGCGMSSGEPLQLLRRTLEGYIDHPNFSHVIVLGLGCEVNQISGIATGSKSPSVTKMTIQGSGGTRKSVARIVTEMGDILTESNRCCREPIAAGELKVALICGGSDGYSGISANPALGAASNLLVRHGGTVILSETPETYGAEHLLTCRAASPQVGKKLIERIKWWEAYSASQGVSLNANPTPGNNAGGLTTILEKSLGAITKAGNSNLTQVIEYAEPVTTRGLIFMDGPGYDPVQVTGQIASGANIVAFTTGRGSVFGSKPAPTIKLASNTPMYTHMSEDMDINCGTILEGTESVEDCGQRIFDLLLDVASGQSSKSEEQNFGNLEFAPWMIGPVI